MIREARHEDLQQILELYLHLHETVVPEESEELRCAWEKIVSDDHHLIICEVDGKIVSSCVCVIIPNLTRGVRPYAFVENVVTHAEYRGKGYATACLNYARELAQKPSRSPDPLNNYGGNYEKSKAQHPHFRCGFTTGA